MVPMEGDDTIDASRPEFESKHELGCVANKVDTTNSSFFNITKRTDDEKQKEQMDIATDVAELPSVSFFDLFRFASKTDLFLGLLGALCAIGTGIMFPIMLIMFGDMTNAFVSQGLDPHLLDEINCNISTDNNYNFPVPPPDLNNIEDEFTEFGINVSIVGVFLFILGFTFVTALNFTAENQVYRIRSEFLKATLRQDIGWFDTKTSNDFASRITEDLNKIQDGIGEKIGMFLFSITTVVASILNAFVHGWQLTLVMLVSTPLVTVFMVILAKIQVSLTENELKAYARAGGVAEEVFSSIRTVVAFGGQQKEIDRFHNNLTYAKKAGIKRSLATAIGAGLVWAIIYASNALAFWYGISLILASCDDDPYTSSDLLVVFFSVLVATMQIGQAAPYMEAFSVARGAAASIFAVIDRIPPIDCYSNKGLVPDKIEGTISFRNVHFHYPSRPDVTVLQGITFDVAPGQTVALVGASGCGKSTCIQLLQRFYDPTCGSVSVDGNEVRQLNLGWLRQQIGVVGQEPVLFGTTIGENIRYGREKVSDDEMVSAAKVADAHDFIEKLPLKYDTLVGERGAQLSVGQKQRIAIARAVVRQPKILLLDEATSALDTQSELIVQKALDRARQGRSTIIIAHRLTTIRNADRILVIKNGVIHEEGNHEKLMAKRDVYYHLAISQQRGNGKVKLGPVKANDLEDADSGDEETDKSQSMILENQEDNIIETASLTESHPLVERSNGSRDSESPSVISAGSTGEDVSLSEIMKMNRQEWPYITIGIIGSAMVGLSTPIYAFLFSEVLGVLTPGGTAEELQEKWEQGNYYSLMFLILGIVIGFAAFVQSFCFSLAGEALTFRLRYVSFQAMLKQEIGWFDRESNSVGALCARLSGDAASVQGATGARIGVFFQAVTTIIASIILALYYQWKLGLISMAFVPFLLASNYFQARIMSGQFSLESEGLEKSSKVAIEAIGDIRTVASLGKQRQFHSIYMNSLRGAHRQALRNSWIRGVVFGFASAVPMFAYAISVYYGGWLVTNEGLDFTDAFKINESSRFGTQMIGQALAFAPDYTKAKMAASRIFTLLKRVPLIDASSDDGLVLQRVDGAVDYKHVYFSYPTRKNALVLRGLNLAVRAGQTVALVGHNGCGKSTCIQLLERFYDPNSGEIQMDGQDVSSVTIPSLRSKMSIVPQEPILFNMTIQQNIQYGDNSRSVHTNEIMEAARQANIHSFIQSLPTGYDTVVGERGTQLSCGEKQRIAIARALVRNPKILLLDEATSALDSESERVVQMALDAAREGRTCINIAHKLSSIQNADKIVVVNNGVIEQHGRHEELIRFGGLYSEMCSTQGIIGKPGDFQTT